MIIGLSGWNCATRPWLFSSAGLALLYRHMGGADDQNKHVKGGRVRARRGDIMPRHSSPVFSNSALEALVCVMYILLEFVLH